MRPLFIALLITMSYGQVFGQNNWKNWYFGNYAGLSFSPAPMPLSGGQTTQLEGAASISDDNGNLLFYSDGVYVWDRTHNLMPNGSGLKGGWSTSQSALIVPIPGQTKRYYLFSMTVWQQAGDLTVSVVDMGLNGGLGDVEAAGKNQILTTNQTEKLVSATASSCGVWVITHQRATNRFESRLVTSAGIASPVYSSVGSAHISAGFENLTGVMKVSHDNRNIALATPGGIIELFNFDNATGTVSDPINISTAQRGYGVCFSPDNSKLYVTEGILNVPGYDVSQFDISDYSAAAVNGSRTFIGRATQPSDYLHVGDLQAAPDGKIYFTKSETTYLGCIPSPNLPAPSCGFIDNAINLGAVGLIGLPNEIRIAEEFDKFQLGNDTSLCTGQTLLLTAPSAASYEWSNGVTTDQINISEPGTYWVKISDGICFASDTIGVSFDALPDPELGNDTAVCSGRGYLISPAIGSNVNYLWQDGSTGSSLLADNSGKYWLQVTDPATGCMAGDTINIEFSTALNPTVDIGTDTTVCAEVFVLNAGDQPFDYTWQDGSKGNTISVRTSGLYVVTADDGGCITKDSVRINFNKKPGFTLGEDKEFCNGDVIVLGNDLPDGYSYIWNDGSTAPVRTVNEPGMFKLTASNECGEFADEIIVKPGECVLAVPNAFTPDGDGKNDVFRVSKTTPLASFSMQVFNRWGQKVFESRDQLQGWNGRTSNKNCDPGNYPYLIQYRKPDGTMVVLRGVLLLVR